MSAWFRWTLTAAIAAGAAGGGYWIGHHNSAAPAPAADSAEPDVTPAVQTALIHSGTLTAKIIAFGPVQAEPSDVTVSSVPFEVRVKRVLVRPGQTVEAAAPLCDVEPSPDTQLQLRQAQVAVQAAKMDLAQTEQRFADKLATNSDLLTSQGNLDTAQLKLDSLTKGGAGGPQTLKAESGGIVSKVDVQEGQIVAAGGPLVEVAAGNKIEARLGVEPEDAAAIHVGDPVSLTAVGMDSAAPVEGKVSLVSQRLNPDTRLVDVIVSLPPHAGLLLDATVRAELPGATAQGLIVPRQAVLPDGDDYKLFTIKDGKAAAHTVTLGLEDDDQAIVAADGLADGDAAVIVGNYELDDGMSVTIQNAAATELATTQPATRETAP
jgi:membrane fusion protein (multidrug efflux system)